jgi:hypothetical protein
MDLMAKASLSIWVMFPSCPTEWREEQRGRAAVVGLSPLPLILRSELGMREDYSTFETGTVAKSGGRISASLFLLNALAEGEKDRVHLRELLDAIFVNKLLITL